jgi:outer membrane protein OmpA-like peptidoglycan-associated protein
MRARLVVGLLVGLSAAPLTAQQKGSIEIGGFGKFTDYSKSFETSRQSANAYGAGGRLGYFLNQHWELELSGSGNATDVKGFFQGNSSTALTYYPFHLRLNFNKRLGANSPFTWLIGAGPGYNRYGKNIAGLPGFRGNGFGSDWAASGLTGFRAKLTNWLDFRLDGTVDYIPSPNNAKAALIAQGSGITATSPASSNTDLGIQAGLSVVPGRCDKSKDGTTISPTSASIPTGGSASFTATATNCGRADQVVYTVSGPGSVDPSGRYTATTAGTATVTACGRANRLCSTATVTVAAPAPPPPPARTLTRCELAPAGATPRIDRPVTYTVTGTYSDGTTAPLPNATLTSPGGQVSGSAVSWSTPGSKTITADCGGGVTAQTTADVQQINIVVRDTARSSASSSAFFKFNKAEVYRTNDQTSLNQVAQILKEHPDVKLVIDGHTDSDGPVAYNAKLGMNRAIAVKNYLAKQGAPVDKMTIQLRSFGECVPVASNKDAAGRAMNRRAELKEYGNTEPAPASATCKEAGRERKP